MDFAKRSSSSASTPVKNKGLTSALTYIFILIHLNLNTAFGSEFRHNNRFDMLFNGIDILFGYKINLKINLR